MPFLSWLNPIKAIGEVGNKLANTFVGSKAERDQQGHEQNMGILGQFAAEFRNIQNRTWWDSLWDGLNRMPRPVIVATVLAYFYLAYINPTEFQVLNVSLDGVPEHMWYVLGAIVGFYFAARHLEKKAKDKMALSQKDFDEMQRRIKELRDNEPIDDKEYKRQMADETTPLTNEAIKEWNRRRKIK